MTRERPIEDHVGDGRVPFEEFVECIPGGGGMDLDIAEVQSCVGSGRGAGVIARDGSIDPAVDHQGAGWSKDAGGGRGPDREGHHRKQIMEVGPIGELDSSGGDGPRTLLPVRPKAATAPSPRNSSPNDAPVCVADQSAPESVDRDESKTPS